MKDNRSIATMIQQPRQQLKISILLSAGLSILFCAFVLINLNLLQANVTAMATDAHAMPSAIDDLNRSFAVMVSVTILFASVSVIAGVLIGMTMTTRLFGPVVPIRRLIKSYLDGDFKARAYLRKNDELQDIMKDLNELGASLEQRQGQKT